MSYKDGDVICQYPEKFVPRSEYMDMEFAVITVEKNNLTGTTRLIPLHQGITIWGVSGKEVLADKRNCQLLHFIITGKFISTLA